MKKLNWKENKIKCELNMREINTKKLLNIAILIVVITNIIVMGVFGSFLLRTIIIEKYYTSWGETLKVARTSNPVTMDPCDSWDTTSNDMLDQVVETLIAYDLSDPDLPLVGRLSESWYWANNKTIVFQLHENVFFHDGSRLTGECVLHTFERINFFGNATGTLDPLLHTMAFPHSLYKFEDKPRGLTPIFNHTLSFVNPNNELNVTLILNAPFAPAEGLLTYTASAILHPDSTPVNEMLELDEDLVIGTGPFKLEKYVPNSEIRFARWERYWRTGAYWDYITYVYYRDGVTTNNAMLALDIDYLGQGITSLKPDFEADPDITVTGDGINEYINSSLYWYVAFNSEVINRTWRKAISHAFNYTYLIQNIDEDTTVRARSLVPPGFPAHNNSVKAADYNIPKARQYLQKMGYGVGWEIGFQVGDDFTPGADEALWQAAKFIPDVGNFTDNLWNFRHRQGSHFMELLINRFYNDLDLIGIQLWVQTLDWIEFIEMGQQHPEKLHLYYLGWGPDYFNTFQMIDPLVNPASDSNFANIDNPEINALLKKTVVEIDMIQREQYYKKLQYLIIDKYAYHMPLQFDKLYYVHTATLKGFPYNPMRMLYFYPTYRN